VLYIKGRQQKVIDVQPNALLIFACYYKRKSDKRIKCTLAELNQVLYIR